MPRKTYGPGRLRTRSNDGAALRRLEEQIHAQQQRNPTNPKDHR